MRKEILSILQFSEGPLPIKYLGIPLIPTKLTRVHYQDLVNRISTKIQH